MTGSATSDLRLWPRLLHSAKQVDEQLHAALEELRTAGAALELNEQGGLRLAAGFMGETNYQRIRNEVLSPKGARMGNILARARTLPHPWLTSVQEAAEDLAKRCRNGAAVLTAQIEGGQRDRANLTAAALIERQVSATYVCQSLYLGGWQAYGERTVNHAREMVALIQALTTGGVPFRARGIVWPIQTPDGRIWVADVPTEAPDQVKVDKDPITRAPDELLIDDIGLAEILAPLDQSGARREVG